MRYNSFNEHMKNKYGTKVYKLSLSCGKTCPNRDGTIGFGGCSFCAEGSGTFAQSANLTISEQIQNAKELVSEKLRNVENPKYIAYFQSFTSTYVKPEILKENLVACTKCDDIVEIRVATRPDCLSDDILNVLKDIAKVIPLSVELGLQTSNDETAEFFNRGYKSIVFSEVVLKLKKIGVDSICHIIIGLPNPSRKDHLENQDDILKTIDFAVSAGVSGIKLQLLHVLKGTKFEELYDSGYFSTLSLESYTDIICESIERIPQNIVIERITGDPPRKLLVSPEWSLDKKRVLSHLNGEFEKRNIIQGSKLK